MTLQSTHAVRHNDLRHAYIRKSIFQRIYPCILAVFAPVSAKCTYENSFFLKIIRAKDCVNILSQILQASHRSIVN